jgi:small subunit ribosomal protein S7
MRKRRAEKRRLLPDPMYNDVLVTRFINNLMLHGKKNTARSLVYEAFEIVAQKTKQEPLDVFKKAVSNVAPVLEVRSRRVGGATYQVPVEVREEPMLKLAVITLWHKN